MRFRRPLVLLAAAAACVLLTGASSTLPVVVFETDFESGLPPEFSAPGCVIEGVQGYNGLGSPGRQFGGNFLRYTSVPLYPTKLTVRNLPPHDELDVYFLQAIIDSWDSTEILQISVDGVTRFSHRFSLALADTTTYSPAPPGALLSMGTNLGFSAGAYYGRDRAYDLGAEPAFHNIPHTADSVEIVWSMSAVSGPAANQWQGGADESWAIDAVRVTLFPVPTGVGDSPLPRGFSLAGATPNPVRPGALAIRFALPSSEPATLEIVDLAGRRAWSSEVGGLGAGPHVAAVTGTGAIAPGLYFARLVQGPHVLTRRIVVIK